MTKSRSNVSLLIGAQTICYLRPCMFQDSVFVRMWIPVKRKMVSCIAANDLARNSQTQYNFCCSVTMLELTSNSFASSRVSNWAELCSHSIWFSCRPGCCCSNLSLLTLQQELFDSSSSESRERRGDLSRILFMSRCLVINSSSWFHK